MPNNKNLCSITNFIDDLRYYYKMITFILPTLLIDFAFNKILNVGRVLIINYPQLELFGRLAVLLEVFFLLI